MPAVRELTREEELHWLALKMVPGLGTRRAAQLIQKFKSPEAVFQAATAELEAAGMLGGLARSISSGCSFEDGAVQQQRMLDAGAALIPLTDARYPRTLRDIFDPPLVLFARGRLELLARAAIGVVGTRRPTPYGLAAAERLSTDLARAGLAIASGMARGIDTAAHKAALAAGGDTVAVLGSGVDVIYPSENRRLAAEIAAKGIILSEFPMGASAFPQNFPIRNRIISGISCALLVIEGAQYSGSAITARLAMDQGREVFAVPGNITSPASWGPNLLIKQGAHLCQDWNDIVVDLPADVRLKLIDEGRQRILGEGLARPAESVDALDASLPTGPQRDICRRLLLLLQLDTPLHLDFLLESMDRTSGSEVIAALFELEMSGLVRQSPGKNFVKVWGPNIG